ncbi:INTEGRAL MEMBRANE PROTEIN (Rhomboid family) [Arcticibacter svalbardensis MN12-7]|uniref:INTEGRAL MEMBRANE PROTEIN (Rhomboid family) n=1 Tax=Arcticibacter svalbardensis MN12-7 TaxID=1150600 RepID=R9GMS0_9SPHI|nr:INTEGRAL MEMBRANE PROTEIN (Rhomboid family) [Arcticibacter svalbardensis]EOR93006.1 INTEGRAL MEMBRANE PROTEIN (Rhomboid family) [Arcticibacter svalbardensis MN12-7]
MAGQERIINKLPAITISFWIMKICATTLGETAGDLLSMTMNIGYAVSSVILLGFFFTTLLSQLLSRTYHPLIYWLVILATSTAGTTMSDFMDRTLGLGYAIGSLILMSLLITTLIIWNSIEKSLSVTNIRSTRGEIFYWSAILLSNTLGTALGDFLADNSELGFTGGAMLIGGLLLLILLAYCFSNISPIILFWLAFVLTRPFGATFGDLLTKTHDKGGLGFGTIRSSLILFIALITLVIYEIIKVNKKSTFRKIQTT